jgi:hypothetical protein
MGHELVSPQIPVDPAVGAATLLAIQHVAVEGSCGAEIIDRDRKVEAGELTHVKNPHSCRRYASITTPLG